MSSVRSPSPRPDDEGTGCRDLAVSAGVLVLFAVVVTATGLLLALGENGRVVQQIGFALYGAGAPVSGVFAAIAGELPLAPFTDLVLWLVLAVLAARTSERRGVNLGRVLTLIVVGALVVGTAISFLIERV